MLNRLRPALLVTTIALLAGLLLGVLAVPVQALTVSPVRLEITVDPGSTYQGETILRNEQKQVQTFYSSFENFEARGDSGTPYFIPGADGLAGWMTGAPESVTLEPGERRIIPFSVAVPSDAKPGGYFAAILWNNIPPQPTGGGQLAIGAKVGSLVLLRVSGEVTEDGGIAEFATEDGRTVYTSLPVMFSWRFQNSGGDRVKPEGNVRITNTLGMLAAEIPANPSKGNILPGSTRKFDVRWDDGESGSGSTVGTDFFSAAREQARNWRMGRYVADLQLNYGEAGTGNASFTFYVLPWQLLSILALIVLSLLLIGRSILSGYKRRILAQARAAVPASRPRSSTPVTRKKKVS